MRREVNSSEGGEREYLPNISPGFSTRFSFAETEAVLELALECKSMK
jgi:hypothetical protein